MKAEIHYLKADKKTGILRYRRVFPEHLRPFIAAMVGKPLTEWKRTLEARTITEPGAMARYEAAHARCEALVAQARKLAAGAYDPLPAHLIDYLAGQFLHYHAALDEASRWGLPPPDFPFETRQDREGDYICSRELLDAYDSQGLVEYWREYALTFTHTLGHTFDPSTGSFASLCRALGEAACRLWLVMDKRDDGVMVDTPPAPPVRPEPPQLPQQAESGKTFRELLLALIEKPHLRFKEPTKERVRGGLRFLVEAVGDLKPDELTRERVTVFLDLLAQRPAKLPTADFSLKLPELAVRYAEHPDVPRLTQKTLEAYVIALSARWKDAQEAGWIPKGLENPFSARRFRREGRRRGAPKGFTPEELQAYFSLPPFAEEARPLRGKGEAIYWIPLLLLFTGARPEEVAQLLVTDIFRRPGDGRWVIRFTDEGMHPVKGWQSLKTERTESGRRTFPVPQALLDLGLLDYQDHLVRSGEAALFPLLRRKGKRSGIYASFGEWMGPYVYDHGVLARGEGREPLREFRHTWATAARVSRIPKEARKYIQGHKDKDDNSSSDDYGALEALGDRIDDFRLPIDVMRLVSPWKPPT